MHYVMDFFGQVPFRPTDAGAADIPEVLSRSEAFDFIIDDLTSARDVLPSLSSAADAGRASQEAVDFLLARLYLTTAVSHQSTPETTSAGTYDFSHSAT